MPNYALLGATGSIGSAILSALLSDDANTVNAYCRSAQKFRDQQPKLASNSNLKLYDGALSDARLLANVLRGTRAAFLAVAAVKPVPGCRTAQDQAEAVLAAVDVLQSEGEQVPRLVVLSSASTEHRLMRASSPAFLRVLYTALFHIYEDLKAAEATLRARSDVDVTFVKPGAVAEGDATGHEVSFDEARSPVTRADLAAGFVEVGAGDAKTFAGRSVAVNSRGDVPFPWTAPLNIVKGLGVYYFPVLAGWL